MFPRARVIASLKKYAIAHDESMTDAELIACLGRFYADRTLLKTVITPRDQAAAIRFLAGPESSRIAAAWSRGVMTVLSSVRSA